MRPPVDVGFFPLACIVILCFHCKFLEAVGTIDVIDWQWRAGRATHFGTDGWDIHRGNRCICNIFKMQSVCQRIIIEMEGI